MPTSKRTRPQQHLTIGNLSDLQRDHLRAIGGGNLTEGIRRLLDQAQEQPKWEYDVKRIDTNGTYRETPAPDSLWIPMDALGAGGWEIVAVGQWEGDEAWATFKRRVVTEASNLDNAREPKENEHGEAR